MIVFHRYPIQIMNCVKVHLRQRHIVDAEIQIRELQDKKKLIQQLQILH